MSEEVPRGSSEPPGDSVSRFDYDRLAPTVFFVLFALTAVGLVVALSSFLADLVVSFVLVALFRPTWHRLNAWLGGESPWLASGLVTVLILIAIVVPVTAVAATIVAEAMTAFESVRRVLVFEADAWSLGGVVGARLEGWANALGLSLKDPGTRDVIGDLATWARAATLEGAGNVFNRLLELTFHFVIVMVCVFYLLVDADRLRAFAFKLSPLPDDEDAMLADKFSEVARGILVGNGIGSALQGLLGGAAMALVGVPSPVFWGAVMALLAFLPIVGISIVTIPASIYLFVIDRPLAALLFFVFCTAQGLFIENVVKTHLIGQRTRMHDLLVLLSILGGISMFGVIGLLYGPLLVAAFLTLSELYFRVYHERLALSFRRKNRAQ